MDQLQGVTKFTITRSRWQRGQGMASLISSAGGKMCCLGFFGLACGVQNENLLNRAYPQLTEKYADKAWPLWLFDKIATPYLEVNRKLANINDDALIDDSAREKAVAQIFADHGVEVEFVD